MLSALRAGFQMGSLLDNLGEEIRRPPLTLSIQKVDWSSPNNRRIVAIKFAPSEGLDVLTHQHEIVEESLALVGMANAVRNPGYAHVTLAKYGEPGDLQDLNGRDGSRVLRTFEAALDDAGVTEVHLEPLFIGENYTDPHPDFVRYAERPV
jgi:hypothetical protein